MLIFTFLSGPDEEDGADGHVVGGGAALGGVPGVGGEHVVHLGDGEVVVGDDGEVDRRAGEVGDVLRPSLVVFDLVDAEADDLAVSGGELVADAGDVAEFGRADGREVLGVREEHSPAVAEPFVERDRALARLGGEVRSGVVDADRHTFVSL